MIQNQLKSMMLTLKGRMYDSMVINIIYMGLNKFKYHVLYM